jgi:uncharacterized protein YjiS (DUF1127 family)
MQLQRCTQTGDIAVKRYWAECCVARAVEDDADGLSGNVAFAKLIRCVRFVGRLIGALIALIARDIRARRDMRRLSAFDDKMLRDIGISRPEIARVVRFGRVPASLDRRQRVAKSPLRNDSFDAR